MVVYARHKLIRLLKIDFVRFCIVGGTGFLINLALLTLLTHGFGLSVIIAQLISAEIALFSNFMLHNYWTYKHKKVNKSLPTLIVQFHASTWPAILGSTLMVAGGVKLLHLSEVAALVISSFVALFWNFAWSKCVIWRDMSGQNLEKIIQD